MIAASDSGAVFDLYVGPVVLVLLAVYVVLWHRNDARQRKIETTTTRERSCR